MVVVGGQVGDEVLDTVSEGDEVTGQAKRREIHTKGLIHRSVVFFVFDRKGRVFVNQRTADKEFYPEYWSIAMGGHLGSGEGYEQTVAREVKEETGIDAKPVFMGSYKKRTDRHDRENVKVYRVVTDQKPKLDKTELKQGSFLTMDELASKLKKDKDRFLPETWKLYEILKGVKAKSANAQGR